MGKIEEQQTDEETIGAFACYLILTTTVIKQTRTLLFVEQVVMGAFLGKMKLLLFWNDLLSTLRCPPLILADKS